MSSSKENYSYSSFLFNSCMRASLHGTFVSFCNLIFDKSKYDQKFDLFFKKKPFCTSFSCGLLLCVLRKNDKRRIFLVKNDVRGGISTTTTTTTTRSKLEALEQFVEQFLSNLVSFFFPSVVSSVASKV